MTVKIRVADALEVLRTLPAESVHCVVTSPPYWGLRDYGVPGQLGLEPTPEEHVARMVDVFREVRRVLRADGTAWVNYGDTYNAYNNNRGPASGANKNHHEIMPAAAPGLSCSGLKPKDLVGMPWRIAFALQADGWWLRSDVIWHKPNPMPESVTDRPTKAHEYVFLLAKSARYFYDADAVRESDTGLPAGNGFSGRQGGSNRVGPQSGGQGSSDAWNPGAGRNLRTVWTIATHPFPDAHFATFPPALVEPCIKAGTSERGACATCGAPWERVVERARTLDGEPTEAPQKRGRNNHWNEDTTEERPGNWRYGTVTESKGFRPTCDHGGEPVPCTVLDPFFGAGTVGLVADRLGRNAIGIELNPEYARMAEERIRRDSPLFAEVKTV